MVENEYNTVLFYITSGWFSTIITGKVFLHMII